jgi:hypothetical protein
MFIYLDTLITGKNEIIEEIRIIIAAGNRYYYRLQHLFKSRAEQNVKHDPQLKIVKLC